MPRVAVFFAASPLHYLAARRVALDHEAGARCVLVYYSRALESLVRHADWDATVYIPWPRFEPLPGLFGRHRRLLENLRRVAHVIGRTDTLVLHSPVYDTEAINYFLRGLPRLTGARAMLARILPDGLLNVQRHPLNHARRFAQRLRGLRRLVSPRLDYWRYSGDRIGSDAPFIDVIYVLAGLPHEYDPVRTIVLGPLVEAPPSGAQTVPRALVVGQPLTDFGLMSEGDRASVSLAISEWLGQVQPGPVDYKAHPREGARHELCEPGYRELRIDEPLESYLAHQRYTLVAGCCSTVLFLARQIYGPDVRIAAFGIDRVRFKRTGQRERMLALMRDLSIEVH